MPQTPPDKTIAPQIELAVRQLDALSILPATAAQYFSKLLKLKEQAKAVACQGSLHQWILIWSMWIDENEGVFFRGRGGENQNTEGNWPVVMRDNYGDKYEMRVCPMATKPFTDGAF